MQIRVVRTHEQEQDPSKTCARERMTCWAHPSCATRAMHVVPPDGTKGEGRRFLRNG